MLHSLLVLLSRQRLVSFLTKRFVSCCLHCRGPAGDLYVSLDVRDIPDIERDGINLRSSISISYINAILGSIEKVHFLPPAQSIIFWIFRANVVIGQGLHGSAWYDARIMSMNEAQLQEIMVTVNYPICLSRFWENIKSWILFWHHLFLVGLLSFGAFRTSWALRKKQVGFGCGVLELFLQVTALEGLMDLQVPAGTQPGDILVMPKLGMPKLNKPSSRGDHFFTKQKVGYLFNNIYKSFIYKTTRKYYVTRYYSIKVYFNYFHEYM